MTVYEIQFTIKERETVKVSPYTGKPYKRPRTIRHYIECMEYIEATYLGQAIELGKKKAQELRGQLYSVRQVK